METASKSLIIVGAILISIFLISLGVYVLRSSTVLTEGANEKMLKLEIEEYNNQWLQFEGIRNGSTINSLIQLMMSNYNENKENLIKVPEFDFLEKATWSKSSRNDYIKKLNQARGSVQLDYMDYKVTCEFTDGLVSKIIVRY